MACANFCELVGTGCTHDGAGSLSALDSFGIFWYAWVTYTEFWQCGSVNFIRTSSAWKDGSEVPPPMLAISDDRG